MNKEREYECIYSAWPDTLEGHFSIEKCNEMLDRENIDESFKELIYNQKMTLEFRDRDEKIDHKIFGSFERKQRLKRKQSKIEMRKRETIAKVIKRNSKRGTFYRIKKGLKSTYSMSEFSCFWSY